MCKLCVWVCIDIRCLEEESDQDQETSECKERPCLSKLCQSFV